MILETILFILLGIGIGVFAGLVPGVHVNTTIPLILSFSSFIPNPYHLAVLIVSTAITEIFVDYIPSIFIGAPDADAALSVLPGHRLLLEGKGYEAIKLTVIGGMGGLIFSLVLITLLAGSFQYLYTLSRPYVHYLIILVILFMVFSEKELKKMLSAVLIICTSGILGMLILNSNLVNQQNVLFPTLTGLFGLSTLVVSISQRTKIPQQVKDPKVQISKANLIKSMMLGSLAGILVGFLPAVGISEAATMVQYLGGTGEARSFLVTLSGINVANDVFSLISLFLLGNPRSGASVAIERILGELVLFDVLFLIGVILFTCGVATVISLYLGKRIPKYLVRINYRKLCISVIVFTVAMIFVLTGPFGLLIAFTSTSIGVLCVHLGIRRSHCMGVLLLPTVFFFAGLNPVVLNLLSI